MGCQNIAFTTPAPLAPGFVIIIKLFVIIAGHGGHKTMYTDLINQISFNNQYIYSYVPRNDCLYNTIIKFLNPFV